MKRLCRFYCADCDYAWMEVIDDKSNTNEENLDFSDKCDYCGRKQEAEEIE